MFESEKNIFNYWPKNFFQLFTAQVNSKVSCKTSWLRETTKSGKNNEKFEKYKKI